VEVLVVWDFCLMLLIFLYLQTPELLNSFLLYGVFTKKSLAPTLNAGQNPPSNFLGQHKKT
jgi:hypothetical protein